MLLFTFSQGFFLNLWLSLHTLECCFYCCLKEMLGKYFYDQNNQDPFPLLSLKMIQAQNTFYWKKQRNELLLNILKKPNSGIGPFKFLAEMLVQFFGIDSVPNLVHGACFRNRSSVKCGHGPHSEVRHREKEGHCQFFLFFLILECGL